jgi:hypothetical protein
MPFDSYDESAGFAGNLGVAEKPADPNAPSALGAAWRQSNTVGSLANYLYHQGVGFTDEEGHNPLDVIRDTPYEQRHLKAFVGSRSAAETRSIMGRIDVEEADQKALTDAGWGGTVAQIGMGIVDPTIALPGGQLYRATRTTMATAKSAASVGAMSAAGALAAESVLQSTQATRTAEEGLMSVAAATILGGIIGAGASRVVSAVERRALEQVFEADVQRIAVGSTPVAAGAAASDIRTGVVKSYLLDKVPILGDAVRRLDPVLDVLQSVSVVARRTMLDMAETALRTVDADNGIAQVQGAAVSRSVQLEQRQALMMVENVLEDAFSRHYFGVSGKTMAFDQASAQGAMGKGVEGKLSPLEFKERVGMAMRREGQDAIPEVAEVAQRLRREVFDVYKPRLVKRGLLPEGLNEAEQLRWVNRMYNVQKIVANQADFTGRLVKWLDDEQTRKAQTQDRLTSVASQLDDVDDALRKLAAMEQRLEARTLRTEGALAERSMEAGRTAARADTTAAQAGTAAARESEIEEFIAAMRKQNIPALRERLDALEADYRRFSALEQRGQVSEAAMEKALDDEFKSILARTPGFKEAVEMLTGRRNRPVELNLLAFVAREGGITDAALKGELKTLQESTRIPGVINKNGRSADWWAERFAELAENAGFPNVRLMPAEAIEILQDAAAGVTPPWWRELNRSPLRDAADMADALADDLERAGFAPSDVRNNNRYDIRDIRSYLQREEQSPQRAAPDAAGAGIPPSMLRESAGEGLDRARAELSKIKASVREAMEARGRGEAVANAKAGEAARGADANAARLAVINDRAAANQARRALLQEAREINAAAEADLLARIETELSGWGGKSASDAITAIKAREKVMADRDPSLPRLRSADDAVRRAMDRILGSEQRLSRQELELTADQIVSNVKGTPEGRLYFKSSDDADAGFGSASDVGVLRGPMARRALMIPDELIEDYLVSDAEQLMRGYMRTVIPDLHMVERFGSVDLKVQMQGIDEDYQAAIRAAKSPKEARQLDNERQRVVEKLAAVRDRIRGTYGWSDNSLAQNIGRYGAIVQSYNMITDLGTAAFNSLGDIAGIVFRQGFFNAANDGWAPFVGSLMGIKTGWKESRRQLEAMGVASEVHQAMRGRGLSDLQNPFEPVSRFERAVSYAGEKFQLVNLQAHYTDWAKTVAGTVTMNEVYRATKAVAGGKGTAKQLAALQENGVDLDMARRIFEQFDASKNVIGETHLPNTSQWTDGQAKRAFEAMIAREVEIAVVSPGQEKPLWMSRPVGRLIGQHKSFIAAANTRILLANLQRRDASTLAGLTMAISAGMVSAGVYAMLSGKEFPERPQDWVKEGISKSGVMGWFEEANTIVAKGTRGEVDAFRLIGADKPLSRFSNNTFLGQLMGPSAGKLEKAVGVIGDVVTGETDARTIARTRQLVPLQNLWAIRRLLNEVEDAAAGAIGVEPLERQ